MLKGDLKTLYLPETALQEAAGEQTSESAGETTF
jgi:hypothetical protein